MRIVILARSSGLPSVRRLTAAGRARGHRVRVVHPGEVQLHLGSTVGEPIYRGRRLRLPDLVIPRLPVSLGTYGLAVLEHFALRGSAVLNSPHAIQRSRSTVRVAQLLSAAGLPVPKMVVALGEEALVDRVGSVGGVPVLLRLLEGQARRGVMVCESLPSVQAALQALHAVGQQIVLQQYVRKSERDVRVLVVGERIIAAVRRRPLVGTLRRTLQRGARLEPIALDAARAEVALSAARTLGLEVAAVDLIDIAGRPRVAELNASPALSDIELATGVDVVSSLIERGEQLAGARIPEPGRTGLSG